MKRAFGSLLLLLLLLLLLVLATVGAAPALLAREAAAAILDSKADCPSGFANFGDSFTDTGNAASLFPFLVDAELPPYGETFFGKPSKRFSNGRLVPDFFSLAFRKPLLDPYVKATSFEYQHGINFAQAGATAVLSTTAPPQNPVAVYPFQVNQFRRFFNSVTTTESKQACSNFDSSLPFPSGAPWVSTWLYTIKVGGNDLFNAIQAGSPNPNFAAIVATVIPKSVGGTILTISELYEIGARKFLVFGNAAQGCSVASLTLFPRLPKDSMGCVKPMNDISKAYNDALLQAITVLRPTLPGANVAYMDSYGASLQILASPANYGFDPSSDFSACCGAPGLESHNYNPAVPCGRPGFNSCTDPDKYINWDGIHFTDAAKKVVATFALNGMFTNGGVNYTSTCNLDFSKFASTFTYNEVYPLACETIFA